MSDYTLWYGDCLEEMDRLTDNSIDLILTDPPYYKVKGAYWDRQWDNPAHFIEWIGKLCGQWQRILKPNGSLYVYASPQMAARVEVKIGEWFNVLNRIRWIKEAGWHKKAVPETLRSYLSPWEEIIFAENYGADSYAKGEAGYTAKCDELRGFIFEPLRIYLESERQRAGVSKDDINEWLGFRRLGGMAGRHYFSQSQWQLPTPEHYQKMRECFSALNHGGSYLRRDYEDLRRDYEDLRRPFQVSAHVPYTDVWDFPTVSHYPGKHPCEKPSQMLEHIILASSKPGATVLDCFFGSCNTGKAAIKQGRKFIGIEMDKRYFETGKKSMERIVAESCGEFVPKLASGELNHPTHY